MHVCNGAKVARKSWSNEREIIVISRYTTVLIFKIDDFGQMLLKNKSEEAGRVGK